eukprot:TRINITY_DN2333_c0_g2_i2.p1 TRINITY_DN2333_c0_g2~~TRINITY_DN2333_c0_g2_i2.p1  ORF type:complete len:165 (+),score=28.10 TRINITY_DN2333_c0_g2_i2:37-495(+)
MVFIQPHHEAEIFRDYSRRLRNDAFKQSTLEIGATVKLTGVRRRPELNGTRARVVGGGLDGDGFVTVRTQDRYMKVQPKHLVRYLSGTSELSANPPSGVLPALSRPVSAPSLCEESVLAQSGLSVVDEPWRTFKQTSRSGFSRATGGRFAAG